MASSIYDIPRYNAAKAYSKNDIVFISSNVGGSGVPRSLKYYYALKALAGGETSDPATDTTEWGGYTTVKKKKVPYLLWTPSYNLNTSHNPRSNTLVFGNGYEQRMPDGIHTSLIKLDVSFDMRSESETRAILHFLKTRRSTESFIIKNLPPIYADAGYKKLFICPTFSSSFTFHNNYTVKATFVETNH
tara:strand:- start:2102 stop:2668 length:567 start_codon:yes stop_codon:yes gene_type:complete